MKILLYGLNFSPEQVGIGKYSGDLALWLSSRGHELRVITAPPYFPEWRVQPNYTNAYGLQYQEGVRIQRCPLWLPSRLGGLSRLLHLASFALSSLPPLLIQLRWRPDLLIVVAPAFFCAPSALLISHILGRRCLSWIHIQDFELDVAFELGLLKGSLLRSVAMRWERSMLRGFQICSSISQAMVQLLIAKGVKPASTQLLPNWVDLAAIQPATPQQHSSNPYRLQFGIQPDQVVLMYSGSMNQKQGLDLLPAVILATADLPQLVWFLAGEGPTKAALLAATANMPQVHHLPLQPAARINEWLGAADIHLLPQKGSAADLVLPSKLLGILASGRPVVASSPVGSELAEIAQEAGVCVPPEDSAAFANAVRCLAENEALRQHKGARARRLAEQRFGRDEVLQHFEKTFTQLLTYRDDA